MKPEFSKIILLIFALFNTSCTAMSKPSKIIGEQVPFTKFLSMDGKYLVTEELEGNTAVVVFWASWCGYSRPAIKEIDELVRKLPNAGQARYLAVSIDKSTDFEKLKEVISSLKTEKIEYFYSGNDLYDEAYMSFDASLLPHIFIIDSHGKVVAASHSTGILKDYFNSK